MQWLVAILIEMLATLRCLWRFVDTQKAVVDAREVVMICVGGESDGVVCPFRAGQSCLVCQEMFSICQSISESWIRTGDATSDITPENVARCWMVGLETAKKSLKVTTQRGIRSIPNPATRRFKTQMAHLRYPRLKGMFMRT
jgi:hypothetical protein